MNQTAAGREWAKAWTASVGQAVKRVRARAGLTAEGLSERTAQLGYPLSRNAITALETGRKEFVTVQDVTVLALALHIAPALLLFPVDLTLEPTQLLPTGLALARIDAVDWFSGEDGFDPLVPPEDADAGGPRKWLQNSVALFWLRGHAEGVARWYSAVEIESDPTAIDERREIARRDRLDAERQIRGNREQLIVIGYPLPELPPGLDVSGRLVDPTGRKNVVTRFWSGRAPHHGAPLVNDQDQE